MTNGDFLRRLVENFPVHCALVKRRRQQFDNTNLRRSGSAGASITTACVKIYRVAT